MDILHRNPGQHSNPSIKNTQSIEDPYGTNPQYKIMSQITDNLSTFIVQHYSSISPPVPNGKYQKALLHSCKQAEKEYQSVFRGTLQKLGNNDGLILEEFKTIADHMLADGVVNWGRIYVLFTLSGLVSKRVAEACSQLPESEKEQRLQMFSRSVAAFIKHNAGSWILNQGGWVDMLAHRGDVMDEQAPWGAALLTGGLLVGCAALYKVFKS